MRKNWARNLAGLQFVLAVLLHAAVLPGAGFAACYASPQAALEGSSGHLAGAGEQSSYQVIGVRQDRLLGRNWAVIARCDHPEWSAVAFPFSGAAAVSVPKAYANDLRSPIVVHAGDTVRLRRHEAFVHIEVAAVAEDNGGLGKTVRVRVVSRNTDNPFTREELTAVVTGPADVEMQP
ncbi:MAG: flagella basal body P-ring formation protein FlgA [Acidobacteriota bacterium]|nr:flagella basal body P-ring formation protein FlgA [Acidobacteriota bacterium]